MIAFGLGPALGIWASGFVIDRVGSTRPLFVFLATLTRVEPLVALTTHSMPGALLTLFLWGMCMPMLFTPQQHRLLSLAPEHANVILALNNSTFYLGIAGGAAFGGLALREASHFIREAAKKEQAANGRATPRKVVNVSSIAGVHGNPGQASYSTGKAEIVGLTKTLAKEWGRYNVQVHCVCFGFIETRMTAPKERAEKVQREGQEVALGIPAMI